MMRLRWIKTFAAFGSACGVIGLAASALAVDFGNRGAAGGVELLRATQESFRSVASTLKPCLVRIDTVGGSQPREKLFPAVNKQDKDSKKAKRTQAPFRDNPGSDFVVADGSTTGLIHSSDGYIITSSFNFVREPVLISVTLSDGRKLAADLVARDQVRKLALLKVDAVDLPVPRWKDADEVRVGEWAIALGLGYGGEAPAVTVGIISAKERMSRYAIQTDAKLSPANYGGPLCDVQGRVIGLCVPMAQRPGELAGVEMYDAGVGFALPGNRVQEIVAVLKTGQSIYRGWLGVVADPASQASLLVKNVADPSPARSAGILPGDRIISAAGRPILHFGHLVQALYMLPAGDQVELGVRRGEDEFNVKATLARAAELGPVPELGEPFDPSNPFPKPAEGEGEGGDDEE